MSNVTQPTLQELFGWYLKNQTTAHAAGLASFDASAEVMPYEAGPVQSVDPSEAWKQATAVIPYFAPNTGVESISAPPNWPTLVHSQEPMVGVAFGVGNYPQLVRNLQQLLDESDFTSMPAMTGRALETPELSAWVEDVCDKKHMPDLLFAVGALRLAKQAEEASKLIERCDSDVPEDWRTAWENEKAALAWHRGDSEQALAIWEKLPDSVPTFFNRGMASLFLDKKEEARTALTQAVIQLPESSAWHHLGQLYLTLAQSNL